MTRPGSERIAKSFRDFWGRRKVIVPVWDASGEESRHRATWFQGASWAQKKFQAEIEKLKSDRYERGDMWNEMVKLRAEIEKLKEGIALKGASVRTAQDKIYELRAEIEKREEALQDLRLEKIAMMRVMWLLVKQVGGKAVISHLEAAAFDPASAELTTTLSRESDVMTIEALSKGGKELGE